MPTLGFLKKKKTKEFDHPQSPTKDSPAAAALTKPPSRPPGGTVFHDHLTEASSHESAGPTAGVPTPMQAISPQGSTTNVPQVRQNNAASIENIINQPAQQPGFGYANGGPAEQQKPNPFVNVSTANPVRETKGKYALNDFVIQRTLGTGSFGRVHLVQSKHNQRFYAVKVLKKAQVVKMKQVEHTNDERKMLQKVKHPFLITLWGTFQDSKNLYMVMDFIEGGELFSLLRKSQVRTVDGCVQGRV